ncbi:MAG: RluA family pseudouridine synthase [Lachnospiraceae bacterium]|nr:RluA family pseudouridine synthase [Lachnospiraceae bacterium]
MYQKTITEREAGQRLDKYLRKLLPEAGNGFLYKMLRKKNIVLNDKKADGSEKIVCGDVVSVYFSQETLQKFMGNHSITNDKITSDMASSIDITILYENEHILIVDKPAGVLTQKAVPEDVSLNEWLLRYLLVNHQITEEELQTFKPSACNRLDRNTSGIVLCAKTVHGAQMLGDALKRRSLHKFYRLYVKGCITEEKVIEGYLYKDEKYNKVQIYPKGPSGPKEDGASGKGTYILTRYIPIQQESDKTLLEVELITGKSHQIRAHLASIGHPLLGDHKYGDQEWNERYRKQYGITHQLLHAYKVVFPHMDEPFADISEKIFYAPVPEIFERVTDR